MNQRIHEAAEGHPDPGDDKKRALTRARKGKMGLMYDSERRLIFGANTPPRVNSHAIFRQTPKSGGQMEN